MDDATPSNSSVDTSDNAVAQASESSGHTSAEPSSRPRLKDNQTSRPQHSNSSFVERHITPDWSERGCCLCDHAKNTLSTRNGTLVNVLRRIHTQQGNQLSPEALAEMHGLLTEDTFSHSDSFTCSKCVCSLSKYDLYNTMEDLQRQLMDAIQHHDIHIVKDILRRKRLNPNFELYKKSPICQATATGDFEVITVLLDAGADPNTPNSSDMLWERRPIHIAASKGHLSVMQLLLKQGADINQLDSDQRTPLHWVAMYGQAHMINWMLQAGAKVNVAQTDGFTPLHTATCLGHKDVCRLLIEGGADLALRDRDGWNSLHTAVCYGYVEIVQLLLERGACPFAITSANEDSTLHIACSKGRVDVIEILLRHHVPLEITNKIGATPLHTAVYFNRVQAAHHLIKAGANVNTKNNSGAWAVCIAAVKAETQILQLLLSAGCAVSRGTSLPTAFQSLSLAAQIKAVSNQPQRLQDLCQLVIRQTLAPNLQTKAHCLPLPRSLIRQIVLENLTIVKPVAV